MAQNAELRKLIQGKLGVGQAQLYRIAENVANSLSISTTDAILLLAAKNQINLQKHGGSLPDGKVEEIRRLLPYLPATTTSTATPTTVNAHGKRRTPKAKRVFNIKLEKVEDDPILDKATRGEIDAMVPVYRTLSQLENSIRQLVARVLKAKHGKDWWNAKAPQTPKEQVVKRMADDQINAWHQKRSSNPIDYLDLNQLPALVRSAQADFVPAFFPSTEWFQQFVDEVYRSRCVVCHMNPLIQTNIDAVAVRYNQWEQLVKAKASDIAHLEDRKPTPTALEITQVR